MTYSISPNTTPTHSAHINLDNNDITIYTSNVSHNRPIFKNRPNENAFPTRAKAWKTVTNNLHAEKTLKLHTLMETAKIKISINMAIADTGAIAHFVILGAPVIDKHVTTSPLVINLPDNKQLHSTQTYELDTPLISRAARVAHIVPGLHHTSLI